MPDAAAGRKRQIRGSRTLNATAPVRLAAARRRNPGLEAGIVAVDKMRSVIAALQSVANAGKTSTPLIAPT